MSTFSIERLSGRIGAVVAGVNLREVTAADHVGELRKLLVEHKVLFFRDQNLTDAEQVAFAARFGEVTKAHPTVPALENHEQILDLDYSRSPGRANNWHTDVTFVDRPPLGSVLRALVIPEFGGDTVWANSQTAYEDLPQTLRDFADASWAVHTNAYDYAAAHLDLGDDAIRRKQVFESKEFETLHPVVRVHPESGARGLFIGGFARRIRGLSNAESADVLRLLQSYVTRLENSVRWKWRVGDVAFWDNRSTQHYAVADYGNAPRHVRRVTLVGDLPRGIDGQTSQRIKGDASEYNKQQLRAA